MSSIKNKILGAIKTKEYVEKGEATCRNVRAVQDIFSNEKIPIGKRIDLINRYIPGIKDKIKNNDKYELMENKNVWLEVEIKLCKEYMDSIGVNTPAKIKKFMKDLLKLDEVKITPTSSKSLQEAKPNSPKLKLRRSSSANSIGIRYSIMVAKTLSDDSPIRK